MKRTTFCWLTTCVIIFSVILGASLASAKPVKGKGARAAAQPLTLETVQAKIADVQGNKELAEELKGKLLNLYQLAQDRLEAAQQSEAMTASYQQAIASAPGETKHIRSFLTQATNKAHPEDELKLTDVPITEVQQRLVREDSNLNDLRTKLNNLDQQIHEQQDRPVKAREQLNAVQQNLHGLEQDLNRPPSAGTPLPLAQAQQASLRAQQQAYVREITLLEQELLSYNARVELLNAQRELAARELPKAEARVKALQDAITNRQKLEAEQAQAEAQRAEREALGKHPAIRRLAEQNAALSQELTATVDLLGRSNVARDTTEAQAKQIEQDFHSAKQKFEIAGLSLALGQILREQRRKLPEVSRYQQDSKDRQQEVARVGLNALHVEEQRAASKDVDGIVKQTLAEQMDSKVLPEERAKVETELRKLVQDQQGVLEKLGDAYTGYLRVLGELDFAQRRLINNAQDYATFLDERLVWIPSARPLGKQTFGDLITASVWFTAPERWLRTLRGLALEKGREPSQWVLAGAVVLVVILFSLQRRFKTKIDAISAQVGKPYSDRFVFTVQALVLTVLLAAPLPLLVATLGWYLRGLPEAASEFLRAIGAGFGHIALPLFLFIAFYRLCHVDGVAEDHFRWQQSALRLLRRHLKWLIPIALPAMFITATVGWEVEATYRDSLGRLAFIVSMLAFAAFAQRILRLQGGIMEPELHRDPHGWIARLRYLWYPLGVAIPFALAVLATVGYYYTARQLEGQLAASVWLVIGGVVVHDLVIRWLTLEQRRLAITKAREKREAARAAQADQPPTDGTSAVAPIELDVPEVDLPTINEQTRQLTRIVIGVSVIVGLWFIWVQVLPALAMLKQVTLWQNAVMVEGHEVQQPITLANLTLAVLITIVMMAAARNLPGVLEIVVLQRLSIAPGSRYAITQVLRYVIFAGGLSGAFKAIGGSWEQIQWIIAALGVGLGFGLQEIFANFISGLIILFERPIRVGDTVTIRDISGTVSRIRMRTTTIIDWDRRALIVPNKTFITEQLINWSLDPTTRIVLKIGVADGTDLALANQLIMDTAKAQPQVLKEPGPTVYFMGVGEKTLNFELSVFVKELENRMPLMHALDMTLHDAFRKHDVNIRIPPG